MTTEEFAQLKTGNIVLLYGITWAVKRTANEFIWLQADGYGDRVVYPDSPARQMMTAISTQEFSDDD